MNISVPELSKRFLRALDSNYNVVDEKSVYEIISTLENTRVTRELLEATRLAKHINELRRKTKDQVLARRSKSLLKRWREMLLPAVPNATNSAPATPNRSAAGQQSVPPSSAQKTIARGQNGTLSTPRGPGRPPKNPPQLGAGQQLQQQQQSSLSLHNSSNSNSGSNNVHKLAAFSQQQQQQQFGKHKENHVNNNSLRVPNSSFASTSMMGIRPIVSAPTSETEVINLTDDRSNSPSMFEQYQQRLLQNHRASPSKKVSRNQSNNVPNSNDRNSLDYAPVIPPGIVITASSANNHLQSPSIRSNMKPHVMSQQQGQNNMRLLNNFNSSSLTSCDNNLDYENSSNVSGPNLNNSNNNSSRKHKKHKKEKRPPELLLTPSKTSSLGAYNHNVMLMDDHSAPNLLRHGDDSLSRCARTGTTNSLILPDNDSLSNTSASIFNNFNSINSVTTGTTTPTTTSGALSFAGHFSKAGVSTEEANPSLKLLNNKHRPDSRSVSPSMFASPHHSNHSLGSATLPINVDPDVILVNHSADIPAMLLSTPITTTTVTPQVEPAKIPKKRGRKKGSKGIDSLLATQNEGAMQTLFNADSFLDLKQKITSISGHKKVKTTKEILSDIQNKRSASGSTVTSPSVTQAPSPESAMSEISHHSQTSTRAVSPEPSTSVGAPLVPSSTEEPSLTPVTTIKPILTEDVELTIKRLLAQLPPIDHKKTEYDNESESDVERDIDECDNGHRELIPKCTCTLREVTENEEAGTDLGNNKTDETQEQQQQNVENPVSIEINIIKDSDEEMADAERERLKLRAGRKRKREKVVKSIFDLDDDNEEAEVGEMSDSEDDLESVPEETDRKDVIAVLHAGESLSQHSTALGTGDGTNTQVISSQPLVDPNNGEEGVPPEMPQFAKYEAVIDPDCAAMRYYETDRNEVTNYHIAALHNRFVPNVNGNWNQREVKGVSSEVKNELKKEEDDPYLGVSIDTANRVVPRYNFLMCDKIPKQFPDFQFDYTAYRMKCRERTRMLRIEARMAKRERMKVVEEKENSEPEEDTVDIEMNGDSSVAVKEEENSSSDIEMRSPTQEPEPVALIESSDNEEEVEEEEQEEEFEELTESNNFKLPSFNELSTEHETGSKQETKHEFSEWYQSVQAVSNGEDLIILPYVVID